jgi:hypothetical protein
MALSSAIHALHKSMQASREMNYGRVNSQRINSAHINQGDRDVG